MKSSLFDSSFSTYVVEKSENVLHLKDFEEGLSKQEETNDLLGSPKIFNESPRNSREKCHEEAQEEFLLSRKDNDLIESDSRTINQREQNLNEQSDQLNFKMSSLSPILQYHD